MFRKTVVLAALLTLGMGASPAIGGERTHAVHVVGVQATSSPGGGTPFTGQTLLELDGVPTYATVTTVLVDQEPVDDVTSIISTESSYEFDNGDTLQTRARTIQVQVGDITFSVEGTEIVTSGTGRFEGASGKLKIDGGLHLNFVPGFSIEAMFRVKGVLRGVAFGD